MAEFLKPGAAQCVNAYLVLPPPSLRSSVLLEMANSQPKWFRAARALIFSRRGIVILKGESRRSRQIVQPNTDFGQRIWQGALSYCLAFVLIFLRPFDRLNQYPQTLACECWISLQPITHQPLITTFLLFRVAMFVAVAAGGAGKAVGAVVSNNLLAALGLCVGG